MSRRQLVQSRAKAFTLIEVLITVGIIGLLSAAIVIAINPLTNMAEARNAIRWNNIDTLSQALTNYVIKNSNLPSGIDTTERQIGSATSGCSSACPGAADRCVDISGFVLDYIDRIPTDPNNGSQATTHYSVQKKSNGLVTIRACGAENDANIYISR